MSCQKFDPFVLCLTLLFVCDQMIAQKVKAVTRLTKLVKWFYYIVFRQANEYTFSFFISASKNQAYSLFIQKRNKKTQLSGWV